MQTRTTRDYSQGSRFLQVSVSKNESVVYSNLDVYILLNSTVIQSFPAVTSFHSYNEFAGVNSYYMTQEVLSFRGFGEQKALNFSFLVYTAF